MGVCFCFFLGGFVCVKKKKKMVGILLHLFFFLGCLFSFFVGFFLWVFNFFLEGILIGLCRDFYYFFGRDFCWFLYICCWFLLYDFA